VLYLRAVLALVLPVTVDVVAPVLLVRDESRGIELDPVSLVGIVPILLGTWLLLDCVFTRFAREGKGTLAPIDPPRFVVRGGAYGVVRNPMYVANLAILLGEALVFHSWRVAAWAAVALAAFHLFVVAYEEPTLARLFGDDYEEFRRRVPRWIPRRSAQ
jgi:protein-S-isoprenylcysteine O-methyltransferase Ste14